MQKILLVTPPLTQLNTPYPATAYLTNFLKEKGFAVFQTDLGIELVLEIFSKNGLRKIFEEAKNKTPKENLVAFQRILKLENVYLETIEPTIKFLQGKDSTLANRICNSDFLPEGSRFEVFEELDFAFGNLGITDKARFLATLYLEDLADFIRGTVSPFFEFSRYAEKLSLSATSFEPLEKALLQETNFVDKILLELLEKHLQTFQPDVVGFSVPFPGNLYGALVCGKFIRQNFPQIKILLGGGFVNTELRELSEAKFFDFIDFVTLDDGERPLLNLLEFFEGKREKGLLKRVFLRENGEVKFFNGSFDRDFPHSETGFPSYEGLKLDCYLSVFETLNPMHRLWSDGRWNKLTLAHGCYWKKCSFCDVTLDYIGRYELSPIKILVDRIEKIVRETKQTGFHFVDEAAPPNLLKELAIELIKRKIAISWWTNIRFEKSFSDDLCFLLAKSGCIAVSGGLEVASDRLLEKMKKGVTVEQVTSVTNAFTNAGIMVHAYLMFGFPTQTEQETIDSLERVRQLFEAGIIHSGFWHRFSLTAHSPVAKNPEEFEVKIIGPKKGTFAWNDLVHEDAKGCKHGLYAKGLEKAIFNFMHGIGFDKELDFWFDFKVSKPKVQKNLVQKSLLQLQKTDLEKFQSKVLWLGNLPEIEFYFVETKRKKMTKAKLTFFERAEDFQLKVSEEVGKWLLEILAQAVPESEKFLNLKDLSETFPNNFTEFLASETWEILREKGLVLV